MQKIDFVNSQQPAINDTNLNLMQTYIETAIQGAVSGDTLPVGAIMPFGGGTVPDNYLLCDGQAVSRTTYAQLFSVIGTNYGVGDGSTTFNVPNLKGKIPVGYDSTQTEFNALGKTGGEKSVTLTKNNLPAGTLVNEAGGIHVGTASGTILSKTTAATAINNLQPYNTANYIIKAFQTAGTVASIVNAHSTSTTNAYSADYVNGKIGEVLYSNSSGALLSNGITLSKAVENYTTVEILYSKAGNLGLNSTKTDVTLSKYANAIYYGRLSSTSMQFITCRMYLNGTSLTQSDGMYMNVSNTGIQAVGDTTEMKIFKVIGYK